MGARACQTGDMSLLERHVDFVSALRAAGLPVSLAEDIDAARAVTAIGWDDREMVRSAYAATLVKRAGHRPSFDTLFDLWFPALIGDGRTRVDDPDALLTEELADADDLGRDNGAALEEFRESVAAAGANGDEPALAELAIDAVGRFGAMRGRSPGLSSWSAYQALKRLDADHLVDRIVAALVAAGADDRAARATARQSVDDFRALVEKDALRRIAEEKGTRYVADSTVRPTIDKLDFMSARSSDLVALRREIQPLARRLAARLTQEHHSRRRGPLDFRRTVRASISTGGVPLVTHQRPKRPHRTELVVLCDVSGSVANFAQFTLLLVHALRDQFSKVRAFTFVDTVTEVTDVLRPGADPVQVMADLAASARNAALWGRTNYGRAFSVFDAEFGSALGPKSSLLVLGDARSNYADLHLGPFRSMVARSRNAWWLNPEHRRNWGSGDSVAPTYAEILPMAECRNITQLGEFVHEIL